MILSRRKKKVEKFSHLFRFTAEPRSAPTSRVNGSFREQKSTSVRRPFSAVTSIGIACWTFRRGILCATGFFVFPHSEPSLLLLPWLGRRYTLADALLLLFPPRRSSSPIRVSFCQAYTDVYSVTSFVSPSAENQRQSSGAREQCAIHQVVY